MIEMRRVMSYGGGSFLESDVMQYRERTVPPSPWIDAPVLDGWDAILQDFADGTESLDAFAAERRWTDRDKADAQARVDAIRAKAKPATE